MTFDERKSAVQENADGADFASVASAFDRIAESFDDTLENEITFRLRKQVYDVLENLAASGATVLDINCGTGIDLLYLAENGYQVYGTDISPKMVALAEAKLNQHGHGGRHIQVCSFDSVSPSVTPPCDLVFSNFGGLNCTPDLERVAQSIASVTKAGGYFVAVLMPPFSLWESISLAARRRWKEIFRRFRASVPATGFGETSFPVHYHSVRTTVRSFSDFFEKKQIIGLSILSPTPQSSGFERKHPVLTRALVKVDRMVGHFPLLRAWGDHYVLVLRRKP